MPFQTRPVLLRPLSILGVLLGTLAFAASLTPSLVPRPTLIQGALGGLSFGVGYGIGVILHAAWASLQLPVLSGAPRRIALALAVAGSAVAAGLCLWWAAGWQNRLRALMELPPIDSAGPWTIAGVALAVFLVVLVVVRLFAVVADRLSGGLSHWIPRPQAVVLALVVTALLFWSIGNGLLVDGAMRMLDGIYAELDQRIDEGTPPPTDPLKSGGPGSLVSWQSLGRAGRTVVAAGPDRAAIEAAAGASAKEPLRVYVGLASAETPEARAELALAELRRIGAFERENLVIVTPTGTGWVDPESQAALEYVLRGDVASVSVQYSYVASWLAMISDPDYGVETARAVFAAVYDHWRALPRDARPRLYLHGLSLGSYNSDLSHDLHQVIGDPYQGALWSGPPFNSRTWTAVTAERNAGTPEWLPTFRDGSVIRFTAQKDHLTDATAPWGPYRVIYLQYASDAVTFFDPHSLWRRPAWMAEPVGPDVSPDLVWIPGVTFLQLLVDIMMAVVPPKGFGHVYAFPHYVDAWASLTGAAGWTPEGLEALKAKVDAAAP
jgi:uncharacterized membrane protein